MILSPNSATGRGAALRTSAAARRRVPAAALAAVLIVAVWAAPAAAQPTAAPTWVQLAEPQAGHLRAEWSEISGATGYELSHNTRDSRRTNQGATRITTTAGIRSVTIVGLDIGRTYYLYVRAVDADGNGPWSALRSITLVGPPPSAPQALAVSRTGADTWRLRWSAPAQPGAGITGYTVAVTQSSLADPDDITDTQTTTGRSIDLQLPPAAESYIYVRATNGAGNGPWAQVIETVSDVPGDGVIAPVAGDDPREVWAQIYDRAIEWTPTVLIVFAGILIFGFTMLLLAAGSRRAIRHLVGLVRSTGTVGYEPERDRVRDSVEASNSRARRARKRWAESSARHRRSLDWQSKWYRGS